MVAVMAGDETERLFERDSKLLLDISLLTETKRKTADEMDEEETDSCILVLEHRRTVEGRGRSTNGGITALAASTARENCEKGGHKLKIGLGFPSWPMTNLRSGDSERMEKRQTTATIGRRPWWNLKALDLHENEVEENCINWISHFPESFTSLVTLNISCLDGEMNVSILERLISRCPNLKTLRLNHVTPLEKLVGLLHVAPQLVDLGIGMLIGEGHPGLFSKLESAFAHLKHLKNLSGIWEAGPLYFPAIYSICEGLTALHLCDSGIQTPELSKVVSRCKNLQQLWAMDLIEDDGLIAVASSCKLLRELRIFPSDPHGLAQPVSLTEYGLIAVSSGCVMLESILYFCRQMTNSALLSIANNRPNLTCFRLCIIEPCTPDYITLEPLDAGFGAIVESCKDLRRLSISGLLTDHVFKTIGASANHLEMLSVAFAGNSDAGLHYILSGCKKLRKLEIRDCPFGDKALLDNADKLETMRSLWMSSCSVSLGACRLLAKKMPRLNVEVIDENGGGSLESWSDDCLVEKLYIYRTITGPRTDAPPFVLTV
ncbi:hypothetical protein ZIOFF_018997 [Zingiber officinale]|uniref:Uncharacterized protein n=1 Tax=Zingiber officinale TaxID=94328 RepID=A0A8J5LMJ8_ZINOF|nr:hypothetical protein ZIOFF_018997 [Zingiber officinale]